MSRGVSCGVDRAEDCLDDRAVDSTEALISGGVDSGLDRSVAGGFGGSRSEASCW